MGEQGNEALGLESVILSPTGVKSSDPIISIGPSLGSLLAASRDSGAGGGGGGSDGGSGSDGSGGSGGSGGSVVVVWWWYCGGSGGSV